MLVWALFAGMTAWVLSRLRAGAVEVANPAVIAIPVCWGLASLRVSRLDSFFVLSVVGLMGPALEAFFRVRPAPGSRPVARESRSRSSRS